MQKVFQEVLAAGLLFRQKGLHYPGAFPATSPLSRKPLSPVLGMQPGLGHVQKPPGPGIRCWTQAADGIGLLCGLWRLLTSATGVAGFQEAGELLQGPWVSAQVRASLGMGARQWGEGAGHARIKASRLYGLPRIRKDYLNKI